MAIDEEDRVAVHADQVRILVADDHQMLAHALRLALTDRGFSGVAVVEEITPEGIIEAADAFQPTVALLDLHLGGGATALAAMRALADRGVRVLAVTGSSEPVDRARCVAAGAVGVLEKTGSWDELVSSISDAALGMTLMRPASKDELLDLLRGEERAKAEIEGLFATLTPRESEILAQLMAGRVAAEIAAADGVSVLTVRTHISAVLRKLGVSSQLAAVALANQSGWQPEDLAPR